MQKIVAGMPQVYEDIANCLPQINYSNIIESSKVITKSMSSLSDALSFNTSTYLKGMKMIDIEDSIKGLRDIFGNNIEKWRSMSESLKVWNEQIQSALDRIPDEDYEILLKSTEYTKDDVIEDICNIIEEANEEDNVFQQIFSDNTLNPKEKIAKVVNEIYKRSHVVCFFVLIMGVLLSIHDGKEALQNTFIPFVESIIVAIEGNQNKYFI